jgi:hypothetical protein
LELGTFAQQFPASLRAIASGLVVVNPTHQASYFYFESFNRSIEEKIRNLNSLFRKGNLTRVKSTWRRTHILSFFGVWKDSRRLSLFRFVQRKISVSELLIRKNRFSKRTTFELPYLSRWSSPLFGRILLSSGKYLYSKSCIAITKKGVKRKEKAS